MARTRQWLLGLALVAPALACTSSVPPPGKADQQSATAMGDWNAWRTLTPLIEVASTHAPKSTIVAMKEASALLAQGKGRSADKRLAQAADTAGRRWVAVARADLAAFYFEKCIRGVAWRLAEGDPPDPTDREMDFSEETRVEPGDVSVEALLTNLDDALASDVPALVTQARIARARVGAFTQRCAPNDEVSSLAQSTVESDLATLAAEGHLTPDLAYLWAGVQMNRFSGAAARPFLLQAREGGFEHPAVTFMLAVIALEERALDRSRDMAREALAQYEQVGDETGKAETHFILGEIEKTAEKPAAARREYETALELNPTHMPSILAIATLILEAKGEAEATDYIHASLPPLVGDGTLSADGARGVATNLESLVILATEPAVVQLTRDALLSKIEREPDAMRRGLRYFYAATLDVRLREYQMAEGHALLARDEFQTSDVQSPIDVDQFLERLRGG